MERLFTPAEVGELMSVSTVTVKYWMRTGLLKGLKVGGQWRIHPMDLKEFMYKGDESYEGYDLINMSA